jgi:hypothetical protein
MLASRMPDESRPVALSLPRPLLATTLVGGLGLRTACNFFVERLQSLWSNGDPKRTVGVHGHER